MISPYFVRCGIASYSAALSEALSNVGCDVYGVRLPRFGRKTDKTLQDLAERIPIDKVDCLHIQHEYGLWQSLESSFFPLLKRLGKPIVTTMHAIGNWQVDGGIYTCSDTVIVHNEFCARKIGFPTRIIPHGLLPTECPPRAKCKKILGIEKEIPLVGYCGFISSVKGLEILIGAMVNVKAGLIIGGGWHVAGTETQYIEQLKENSRKLLEKRSRWLGYIEDDDLATVYGGMDIVVYPSRWATESGALLTAIAHGKAIIANSIPPFKEKEKQGALLTFKDQKDLTRKIKRLIKNEDARCKLENGAKKYAKANSWTNIAKKHVKVYRHVLGDD